MVQVAAPAVHVDSWKHWNWFQGKDQIARTLPDGCGVVIQDDKMFFEDLSTGRLYQLPPLSPDAQAWAEANKDDLRGGKNWLRRQAEQRAMRTGRKPVVTPQTGPFTWAQNYYFWIQTYPLQQHVVYITSFFGVAQLPQTLGQWLIQSFRGNKGNTGPAFGRPLGAGLPVSFSNPLYQPQITRLTEAVCSFEIVGDGGVTNVPYFCSDICVEAVFGGVTLKQPGGFSPVNWSGTGIWDAAGIVSCFPTATVSNPTANGTTALSVSIASS